jgi:hypothetical protein
MILSRPARLVPATTALALLLILAPTATRTAAAASERITNGGFESGLSGWTRFDQVGGDGSFFQQSGTTSPVNAFPVPAPPGGLFAAMTDAAGPGAHVLYQDFVVPAGDQVGTLRFSLFIGNRAFTPPPGSPATPNFFAPNTLDFSTPALNEQARVDIILPSADPFSLSAADVLLNVYRTQPNDPLVSGYNVITSDVSSLIAARAGQTLRLRFAETDNVDPFQLGIDNVSLVTAVPEPSAILMLATGLLGVLAYARSRQGSDAAA